MERQITDLFTLCTALKKGIEGIFPSRVWLRAEISSLKYHSSGHCYIDLSQSNERGLIAQVRAVVWASKFRIIGPYFQQVTGMPLQKGITVLLYVQVSYSQLYGLSLVVDDIDPAYTLGEKERLRRETVERLRREGLTDLQKALPITELPRSIAVITSADAAGFGDFMKHLGENAYGFTFDVTLFPALMQGASCPDSIISALEDITQSDKRFDIVLILRGGGSELDLACYDDYSLCAGIARFPLPVFTAIGHDRDFHAADMVAHQYAKTPTALADMIVEWYADEDARLLGYASRLRLAFTAKISAMDSRLNALESRIRSAMRSKFTAMEARITNLETRIRSALRTKISTMDGRVTMAATKIRSALRTRISLMDSRLNVLEARIRGADPRKIIERGYVLALDPSGAAMKSVRGREKGDRISLMFSDGTMKCTVDDIIERNVSAEGEDQMG